MTDIERILIAVEKIAAIMEVQVRANEAIAQNTLKAEKLLSKWERDGVPEQTVGIK